MLHSLTSVRDKFSSMNDGEKGKGQGENLKGQWAKVNSVGVLGCWGE
ncbi:hypothetical protein VKI21_05500 [Cyanobacterium aponinum UTEX 3222]|nr:hypothetical protein VKI21_05500 [Cyanobacterium aponinum UTEX 3222]